MNKNVIAAKLQLVLDKSKCYVFNLPKQICASAICIFARLALSFDKTGFGSEKTNLRKCNLYLRSPCTIFAAVKLYKSKKN